MARLSTSDLAERHLQPQIPSEYIRACAEQRHLDNATETGFPLLEDRGQNAGECRQTGDVVTDAPARVQRGTITVCHLARKTRASPERADVIGGAVAVLTVKAVAAHTAIDEMGVAAHGRRGLEGELVECVRTEVTDEDVGGRQELLEVLAIAGLTEVQRDTSLTSVVEGKCGVWEVTAYADGTEHVPHGVPGRNFDFYDLSTPVGEQGGRRRCGDPYPELDHPQVGERGEAEGLVIAHAGPPNWCWATRSRRTSFRTLPVAVSGSTSTNSTTRGTLKFAMWSRLQPMMSACVRTAPGFSTTNAIPTSPRRSSRMPITAAWRMSGRRRG